MSEVKTNKISSLASNNNITIDPDGTGNTIVASGSVGVGTTTPGSYNSGADDLVLATTGSTGITIASGTSNNGSLFFADGTSGAAQYSGYIQYDQNNNAMSFGTNSAERMRIDTNGVLLIGRTNTNNNNGGHYITSGYAYLERNNDLPLYLNRFGSDGTIAQFRRQDSVVGSISVTGSSTAYNTSSDYRLKEDIQPMVGASDRLMALNPVNFAWKSDGTRVDGFLAHEAQEVVPESVTGAKDAMRTEEYEVTPAVLDDEGNVIEEAVMGTREVPDYQGIDQSKLVPLLTAALQEALTEIESLKARVSALETN